MEPYLYSIKLAAQTLSVSRRSIEYLVAGGHVATVTMGRRKMIPRAEIQRIAAFGTAFCRYENKDITEQTASE